MSEARPYNSPKREARAAATREAILEAFVEQISEPGHDALSPSEAAKRAGVSVRTVHLYYPNHDSQVLALGDWFDRRLYPNGVPVASGPDDLARYFREIHANALINPLSRALATSSSQVWQEVRQRRRAKRLDAIRQAVKAVGAPTEATEDATAMLLRLAGADASWPLHDVYGLPLDRIPDVMANTVELIVGQLKAQAADSPGPKPQRSTTKSRTPAKTKRPPTTTRSTS